MSSTVRVVPSHSTAIFLPTSRFFTRRTLPHRKITPAESQSPGQDIPPTDGGAQGPQARGHKPALPQPVRTGRNSLGVQHAHEEQAARVHHRRGARRRPPAHVRRIQGGEFPEGGGHVLRTPAAGVGVHQREAKEGLEIRQHFERVREEPQLQAVAIAGVDSVGNAEVVQVPTASGAAHRYRREEHWHSTRVLPSRTAELAAGVGEIEGDPESRQRGREAGLGEGQAGGDSETHGYLAVR